MTATAVGAEAPNFDLSSTEGVLLMLCDEVPRSAIALYLFAPSAVAEAEADLRILEERREELARRSARILAVSSLPMEELQAIQTRCNLRFPLLRDDRSFLAEYGIGDDAAVRALALVDREQKIRWLARPLSSAASAASELVGALDDLPRSTSNYPRSVLNRFIDRMRG